MGETFIADRTGFFDSLDDLSIVVRTLTDRSRVELIEKNVRIMLYFLDLADRCVVLGRSPRWSLRQIDVCYSWVDRHLYTISRQSPIGALNALRQNLRANVRDLISQGEHDATRANL